MDETRVDHVGGLMRKWRRSSRRWNWEMVCDPQADRPYLYLGRLGRGAFRRGVGRSPRPAEKAFRGPALSMLAGKVFANLPESCIACIVPFGQTTEIPHGLNYRRFISKSPSTHRNCLRQPPFQSADRAKLPHDAPPSEGSPDRLHPHRPMEFLTPNPPGESPTSGQSLRPDRDAFRACQS